MIPPPTSVAPPPSGFPDRARSRAVTASFVVVLLAILAYRAYAPQLRARPTDSAPTVDVNTASRAELVQVPGIGPQRADAILAHRDANGPFARPDDLHAVHGIGPKTLDKLRPLVSTGGPAADTTGSPVETLERKPTAPVPAAPSGKIRPGEPPVNANTASLAELQRLPGIGPVLAQKIIETRTAKPFDGVEDLRRVPRLGAKTLDGLRPYVTVGDGK